MKPPKFDYFAPDSIDGALSLIAAHGEDARFLAGGQSLVPMLNFRVAAPSALIDLNRIAALRDIRGGSLAHADPAAELPGIVLVCGADIHLQGPDVRRVVSADDFFDGIFSTAIAEGEIIAEIVFPAWPKTRHWAFREVSRREGDFAMVGIAAWFDTGADGAISAARIAAIGAGDTPLRLPAAEAVLTGGTPGPALFAAAAQAGIADLQPGDDIHASAEYRREVGGVLIGRVLAAAWERTP